MPVPEPEMTDLESYVDCPVHGVQSTTGRYAISSGFADFSMVSGTAACPVCGRKATIVPADYKWDGAGELKVDFRPTPAQAARLAVALQWAQRELAKADADEERVRAKVVKIIARDAPQWRPIVDALLRAKATNFFALLGFLIALLTFFGLTPSDDQPDVVVIEKDVVPPTTEDQFLKMFEEYVAQQGTGTPSPPPPAPGAPTPPLPPTTEGSAPG